MKADNLSYSDFVYGINEFKEFIDFIQND